MKNKLNIIKNWLPVLTLVVLVSASCTKNENVPEATPINYPTGTGSTIGEVLNTNASFSILKAAVTKAGLMPAVSDKNSVFTVFAPDDAAFTRSGISLGLINALPAATVASIVQYYVVPGRSLTSCAIPTSFLTFKCQQLLYSLHQIQIHWLGSVTSLQREVQMFG